MASDISKNVQCHQSLGKWKSKPHEISPHACQDGSMIKKTKLASIWGNCQRHRKIGIYTALVGIQNDTAAIEQSMEGPQQIKIELPCDPGIPLLDIYTPQKLKARSQIDIYIPMCLATVYTTTKT